jgi:hypothetical protein
MVNTFLVDSDYRKSAQQLDSRRLGKQRVEAYQILNLIENIRILSEKSKIMLTSYSDFQIFVREIKKWYQSLGYVYVISGDQIVEQDKGIAIEKDQRMIKMGFCNHPVVEMWYGYEDALKEYIDAHIEEWLRRGYKNTMRIYNVKTMDHPKWCSWIQLHDNHKGALLRKEVEREEKTWYQTKEDFLSVESFEDYIWIKLYK